MELPNLRRAKPRELLEQLQANPDLRVFVLARTLGRYIRTTREWLQDACAAYPDHAEIVYDTGYGALWLIRVI